MKQYPKILHELDNDNYCYAFDKIDGSNVRFEWSKKRGWYKFGTRRTMISDEDPLFGESIDIFMNKYSEDLNRVFRDNKLYRNTDSFIAFGEFFGENSFAGQHDDNDDMDVVIFDINQYKKGFIPPGDFIKNFGHLNIPQVIYQGYLTGEFIESVRKSTVLKEGVVIKGYQKGNEVWMSKIKTNRWLMDVREKLGEKALLEEFNGDIKMITI